MSGAAAILGMRFKTARGKSILSITPIALANHGFMLMGKFKAMILSCSNRFAIGRRAVRPDAGLAPSRYSSTGGQNVLITRGLSSKREKNGDTLDNGCLETKTHADSYAPRNYQQQTVSRAKWGWVLVNALIGEVDNATADCAAIRFFGSCRERTRNTLAQLWQTPAIAGNLEPSDRA